MIASNQFLLVLRTCVTTIPNQQELWCSGGTVPPLIRGLGFEPWIWRNPVGGSTTSHNGLCNVRSGLVGFQWALDAINQRSRIRAPEKIRDFNGHRRPLTLFAFDQGPLVINAPAANAKKLSLLVFICIATLPLRAKQHGFTSNFNRKIPLNLPAECVILAACMEMILRATSEMHHKLVLIVYCVMIFLVIDILVAFSSFIIKYFVGLEVELDPPSNEPYFSTSLQDFWGRRWNLTVTNMLRLSVYNPVRWVVVVVVGKERARWAQRVAMLATFLVSGLMHELIFYYVNNVRPSWEMTGFFALHGLCVVVETDVKRALKDTWRLSGLISGPLTIGFVMVTSFGLFFPPLIRNGADVKVLEEFVFCCDFFKLKMLQFVSHFG
ncbi:putative endoglucanase 11-like [Capsicum annuum]|nr:putative endoglucanase 11-like [Capsicum annuum]KAF3679133.1 putative endoglucanase 11-like [Capsicum annuum]